MWLLLLALFQLANAATLADSSRGPAPASEAPVLWERGQKALAEARYQDAANDFKRLIARHLDFPKRLEAQILFGRSLMELKRVDEAKKVLAEARDAVRNPEKKREIQLLIGECFLRESNHKGASLLGQQLWKQNEGKDSQAGALLIRGYLGINQIAKAEEILGRIEGLSADEKLSLQIEIKAESCARLTSQESMDEAQARALIQRQATCLIEVLPLTLEALGRKASLPRAYAALDWAFQSHQKACLNPPPGLKGKKTKAQQATYRDELQAVLRADCEKQRSQWLSVLTSQIEADLLKPIEPTLAKLRKGLP